MDTPEAIIGWFVVACFMIYIAIILGGILVITVKQWLTNRKRKRAHAGKLKCEQDHPGEGKCSKIATRVTPNGYFCNDHWEENSGKWGMYASVRYGYLLNHALRSRFE